jgi:hypothetical protein
MNCEEPHWILKNVRLCHEKFFTIHLKILLLEADTITGFCVKIPI